MRKEKRRIQKSCWWKEAKMMHSKLLYCTLTYWLVWQVLYTDVLVGMTGTVHRRFGWHDRYCTLTYWLVWQVLCTGVLAGMTGTVHWRVGWYGRYCAQAFWLAWQVLYTDVLVGMTGTVHAVEIYTFESDSSTLGFCCGI